MYHFPQHKAFYCYILLSLWIFIIIIAIYRYLSVHVTDDSFRSIQFEKARLIDLPVYNSNEWILENRFKRIYKSCQPVDVIVLDSENAVDDNYTLEGIAIVFRHGDRGPLNHVRNLDSITCAHHDVNSSLYNNYTSFITTYWSSQISNVLFQYLDQQPYHPPIPTSKHCEIGQLTLTGTIQHLKLGSILRSIYFNKLFGNDTRHISSNIVAYTTKYRRTFQSLNAFLYGFLREGFSKIPLHTVSSIYYCFDECACPVREIHSKALLTENTKRLKSHPAILKLIEQISPIMYTMLDGSFVRDPHSLKDALMTYVCHNQRLPCLLSKCIYPEHVTRVFSFIDWDIRQFAKSIPRQKSCVLTMYGFVNNIVSHLLKIVSDEKPKIVLYSAHDKTIQFLLTALGINSNEAMSPPYASRVIFEVYIKKRAYNFSIKKFYFRTVFNGKDITHRFKFCTRGKNLSALDNRPKVYLCSFEYLIRFLHDDYFSIFNSTNFKDACATHK